MLVTLQIQIFQFSSAVDGNTPQSDGVTGRVRDCFTRANVNTDDWKDAEYQPDNRSIPTTNSTWIMHCVYSKLTSSI